MKKAAALLLTIGILFKLAGAQEFPKNETNHIRIDPFQLNVIHASEFCWAYDVTFDKKGNTFSTGYLRGYVSDTSAHLTSDNCGYFCTDKLYLAKHTPAGKRSWINSAIGNVRPTAVRINKHGEICLAGSFYGKLPVFLGTHYTQATDSSAGKIDQGFFITKYKSTGEIIACKIIPGKELFAFELDDDGNFYLGGCDEFRTSKEWSLSRRKFKLQRINNDFTNGFTWIADTLGDSHINSLSIYKNQLVALVTFSDTLNTANFKLNSNYMQRGALVYYNTAGNFIAVQDSIEHKCIDPGIASYDENGYLYLATGGYNHPQNIYALKPNGEVIWHMPIVKPSSNFITKLLPYQNKLYLCGYGYGALFGVNTSAQLYAYKAKSSTDFFMAAFTQKGELSWLKAGGGEGTEYCQSMAIYKNEIAAFGFATFGGNFTFNDSSFKASNSIWLAKFKLDALQQMNIWEPNPIKVNPLPYEINEVTCTCTIKADGNENKFMPSVSSFITQTRFSQLTGWHVDSSYALEKNAFLYNFYANPSHSDSYYSFSLYTVKPLKIKHPKNLFTINFTPCLAQAKWNSIPVSMGIDNGIRKYDVNFEPETFDSSTQAIYTILRTINNHTDEELLDHVLYEGDGYFDYLKWINTINRKYKLQVSTKHSITKNLIDDVLNQLSQKQVSIDTFLLREFIYTYPTQTKVNATEWNRLCNLFEYDFSGNLDELYAFLNPAINATLEPKFFTTEITPDILCAWNELAQKPYLVDEKLQPTTILAKCTQFDFISQQGSKAQVEKWYHNRCNITGTQLLLKFKDAKYIDTDNERRNYRQHAFYELLIDTTIPARKHHVDGFYHHEITYLNDITNFCGLYTNSALIWLPINQKLMKSQVEGLVVNNLFIAATIEIAAQKLPNNVFQFSNNNEVLTINEDELMNQLNNLGFDKFIYQYTEGILKISFIKRNTTHE